MSHWCAVGRPLDEPWQLSRVSAPSSGCSYPAFPQKMLCPTFSPWLLFLGMCLGVCLGVCLGCAMGCALGVPWQFPKVSPPSPGNSWPSSSPLSLGSSSGQCPSLFLLCVTRKEILRSWCTSSLLSRRLVALSSLLSRIVAGSSSVQCPSLRLFSYSRREVVQLSDAPFLPSLAPPWLFALSSLHPSIVAALVTTVGAITATLTDIWIAVSSLCLFVSVSLCAVPCPWERGPLSASPPPLSPRPFPLASPSGQPLHTAHV